MRSRRARYLGPQHRGHQQHGAQRRGIVLLVTLVLLVLFLLLGVTYALTAIQWRKTALSYSRTVDQHDDGFEVTDAAVMQLVHGASDPVSPLHYISLLDDMYGNDSFRGTATANAVPLTAVGGQFCSITLSPEAGYGLNPTISYYTGCIMTPLTGPATGQSRRIVDYDPTSRTFQVETFTPGLLPLAGNQILINGRPFNGTGNGYNPATGRNNSTDANGRPYALLPNLVYFSPNTATGYLTPGGLGGNDVEYTAADFNHPWLAASEINPTSSTQIKPSFHDPALLNYWNVASGGAAGSVASIPNDLLHQIMFRPMPVDHPKFTGSNPLFNPITGPWDVDCDNDGVFDSVWMDIGLPVRKAPDGRLCKPLVAFLIQDQGGRINVNVHGNQDMLQAAYTAPVTGLFAGAATSITPQHGQGYGPWEINPLYLYGGGNPADVTGIAQFRATLEGGLIIDVNGNGTYDAAAGDQLGPGRLGWVDLNSDGVVQANEIAPGIPQQADILSQLLLTNLYGAGYNASPGVFVTPWDPKGHGVVALDMRGQAMFVGMGETTQWIDGPWEQAVSHQFSTGNNDNAFTPAEAEAVYRPFDVDSSSLPKRLVGLAPRLIALRNEITVDQWDAPVPSIQAPRHLRDILRQNNEIPHHVTDLVRARIIKEHMINGDGWTLPLNTARAAQAVSELNSLLGSPNRVLPPDLLAGLRFDINRVFGNGLDDNGNGIVDDLAEVNTEIVYPATLTNILPAGALRTQFANVLFDHNGDGVIDAADKLSRYQYAKQLYVLLMLLADSDAFPNLIGESGLTAAQKLELMAKRLAEFAINAADYRDPDSTMTPFEYDINPWNGWSVDGVIYPAGNPNSAAELANAERRVVWGCEAGAVVLSEAMALHNTRTDDLTTPNNKTTDATPDADYDQKAIPQGTFIFEVYSPASAYRYSAGGTFVGARDIYTASGAVDLAKKNPDGLPVWRVAISAPHLTNQVSTLLTARPDSTTLEPGASPVKFNEFSLDPPITIERVVWFCNTTLSAINNAVLPQTEKDKVFYNRDNTITSLPLAPGRYLVVGPRAVTPIGKANDGTGTDSIQQIKLNVSSVPVDVTSISNGATTMPATGTQIQAPTAIICGHDRPSTWTGTNTPQNIGLNVSEPLPSGNYYPEPTDLVNNDNKYTPALDHPLDGPSSTLATASPAAALYSLGKNTTRNYRTVFLQRLADPTQAYDQYTNPYITVDFMPIDLTMFNGDAAQFGNPDVVGTVRFRTRERGDNTAFNIWAPPITTAMETAAASTPVGASTSYFSYSLIHSFGFLNNAFNPTPATPFGQLITSADPAPITPANYGDPRTPFPLLSWFDRPYISPYELMMVPASTPARLNFEFSNIVTNPGDPYIAYYPPFRHLLNFFETSNNAGQGTQLCRIFDYLYVPSKYTETQTILNPSRFAGNDAAGLGKGRFRPPFNLLSRFREPGAVNLNTIYSANVYASVTNNGLTPQPAWDVFLRSRRGYATTPTTAQFSVMDNATPTFIAAPFRSAAGSGLYPLGGDRRDADVTLLRPEPTTVNTLFASTATEAYRNYQAHSYFRYQPINRLGNLVTQRSNTFAVWITVGYFEVEPNPTGVDAYHPDGYRLGSELGADTGNIKRHRSFYLIDRTIPVGFETGRDYNSAQTILLKTHIE